MPIKVAEVHTHAFPLYGIVVLRDPLYEPDVGDGDGARLDSRTHIVASDGWQMFIRCAQTSVDVAVDIEMWNAEPAGDEHDADWEGNKTLTLACPGGELIIDQPTMVSVELDTPLPAGRGTYMLKVAWRNRLQTARAIDELYGAMASSSVDERHTALQRLHGNERYRIQIWYHEALPPDPDDEDEDEDD